MHVVSSMTQRYYCYQFGYKNTHHVHFHLDVVMRRALKQSTNTSLGCGRWARHYAVRFGIVDCQFHRIINLQLCSMAMVASSPHFSVWESVSAVI